MTRRAWLTASLVTGAVLLFVTFFVSVLGGGTDWPGLAVRLTLLVTAVLAVWSQPTRVAAASVAAWAVVACPFPITSYDGTFRDRPQGETIAQGVGAVARDSYAVKLGPIPVGRVVFRRSEKSYLNGEGSYADADLVAYGIGWLPYPHVQRSVVQGLGGNDVDYWAFEERVALRRDGHDLMVAGDRLDPAAQRNRLEEKRLGVSISGSALTWLGWILVAAAVFLRTRADGAPAS